LDLDLFLLKILSPNNPITFQQSNNVEDFQNEGKEGRCPMCNKISARPTILINLFKVKSRVARFNQNLTVAFVSMISTQKLLIWLFLTLKIKNCVRFFLV
jgi:hypothetical protein